MTARLYSLWVLSVILALIFAFLMSGMLITNPCALVVTRLGGKLCVL